MLISKMKNATDRSQNVLLNCGKFDKNANMNILIRVSLCLHRTFVRDCFLSWVTRLATAGKG